MRVHSGDVIFLKNIRNDLHRHIFLCEYNAYYWFAIITTNKTYKGFQPYYDLKQVNNKKIIKKDSFVGCSKLAITDYAKDGVMATKNLGKINQADMNGLLKLFQDNLAEDFYDNVLESYKQHYCINI
ncbi:MAG: hypothetical protein QM529_07225 [Hydrotalea sp.]|nr:hypothetical protein [Hydrotalea sp.]